MSRGCAIASLVLALLAPAVARSDESDDFAAHRARADAHFRAELVDEALREWRAAYALRQEPRLLYDMGRAQQRLGHPRQAVVLFRRYLVAEPTLDEAARGELEARIQLLDRQPDEALPDGAQLVPVHFELRRRKGLVAAGVTLLAVGYLPALIVGALGLVCCRSSDDVIANLAWGGLLVPVAGPFLSALAVHDAVWSLSWSLVDGAAQVAGLVLLIVGETHLARVPVFGVTIAPYTISGGGGLRLGGAF